MRQEKYFLQVGTKTLHRLQQLNQIYNPYSQRFLREHGLQPGQHVLDLGCGFGIMSCWIAQQVGPQGHVTALDISEEQLAIARQHAQKERVNNIEFIQLNVYDIDQLKQSFDLVWNRFLLCHLTEPNVVIEKIYHLLKKGGIFCCDDVMLNLMFCQPPSKIYERSIQIISQLLVRQGKGAQFGQQLLSKLKQHRFRNVTMMVAVPLLTTTQEKNFLADSLKEGKENYINEGIVTSTQFDEIISGLDELSRNPDSYFSPAALGEVAGTK